MASYLTADEAIDRLIDRAEIEATITELDVEAASSELDALAPFIGTKYDTSGAQELAFPRSINPDGSAGDGDVPERVLDWLALAAYNVTATSSTSVKSETIGSTSRTYDTPKVSQTESRMAHLIDPYLLKMGQRVGVSGTWRTHESYPDYPLA